MGKTYEGITGWSELAGPIGFVVDQCLSRPSFLQKWRIASGWKKLRLSTLLVISCAVWGVSSNMSGFKWV